jgi:hypothetical protein
MTGSFFTASKSPFLSKLSQACSSRKLLISHAVDLTLPRRDAT